MKKLIALLLAVVLLTGCQLASEEKQEDAMDDKLVGVFITFEDLGLPFDIEGYIADNGMPGDVITDGDAYEGRLYARLGERGWEFPGYEGLVMGQKWAEDHWIGFSTEGFCEMKTHVTRTDTHDGIEEEGTIYVPADTRDFIFYCNPVYMTEDGEYYAVQGDSFHSGDSVSGMSMTVSEEQTWTEEDVSYTYSAKYTARIEGITPAETVTLIQMSADHKELSRAEYIPGQMPESITPVDGAAYLIVEEYAGEEVTWTLYQPGDDSIQVFCYDDAVYCLPRFTEINWNE